MISFSYYILLSSSSSEEMSSIEQSLLRLELIFCILFASTTTDVYFGAYLLFVSTLIERTLPNGWLVSIFLPLSGVLKLLHLYAPNGLIEGVKDSYPLYYLGVLIEEF